MRYLPDDNLAYPVSIQFLDGTEASGSGFYLNYDNKKLFLVTAKHVLYRKYDENELILHGSKIRLLSYDKDLSKTEPIKNNVDLSKLKVIPSTNDDLALVYLGDLTLDPNGLSQIKLFEGISTQASIQKATIVTVHHNNLRTYKDAAISNEVFILGYPSSIGLQKIPQIDYEKPLLRKGIIAGKNDKKRTIILDCPVYQGNSGGIVIEVSEMGQVRELPIIGVVSQFIPFIEVMESLHHGYKNINYENSGYSVITPTDNIIELVKSIDIS